MAKEINQPNAIVGNIYKNFLKREEVPSYELWLKEMGGTLALVMRITGSVSVMSKNTLLKLVAMQSELKFMSDAEFYAHFSKACAELELK